MEKALKVYTLPVDSQFQPTQEVYRKPSHGPDWNIESDFFAWIHSVDNPHDADYCYLPIFWNKYFILHEWGEGGREELQAEIFRLVDRNKPTFTVCEYDLIAMGKHYDLCNMLVFTGSRQEDNGAIDVPLLCHPHELPEEAPEKKWVASFTGNVMRDGLRQEMTESLAGRDDVLIEHVDAGEEYFVNTMLQSHISLSPRGHGGQTMRFYEAMQLGVVPMLIGKPDTRPFKDWIEWDICSLYAPTIADIDLEHDPYTLNVMGQYAQQTYYQELQYGQWPNLLLKELEVRL